MKTFDVNGKCCISFDPDDKAFAQRIFDAFQKLDQLYVAYKKQAGKHSKSRGVRRLPSDKRRTGGADPVRRTR